MLTLLLAAGPSPAQLPGWSRPSTPARPAPPLPEAPRWDPGDPLTPRLRPNLQDVSPGGAADVLEPVPDLVVPLFEDDLDAASMRAAIGYNDAYLRRFPDDRPVAFGPVTSSIGHLRATLRRFAEIAGWPEGRRDAALRAEFDLYRSRADGSGVSIFTGYFEAEVDAAPLPDFPDSAPVLARPADLVRTRRSPGFPYDYGRRVVDGSVVPYYTRAEIAAGILSGENLAMGAVGDPADLLFLQTQGSGWLRLPGGRREHLGFDGANGRPFRSVARKLIDAGEIPEGSNALDVLAYLKRQPPARKRVLLNHNPRYVFFRRIDPDHGPIGATGVPLTGGRSLAVSGELPRGALAFLDTRRPVVDDSGEHVGFAPMRRFALTQDAGAAIDAPAKIDVFWGAGPRAAGEASRMKAPGELYFLLLKTD